MWLAARDITSTQDIPRTRYDALITELLAADPETEDESPEPDQPF